MKKLFILSFVTFLIANVASAQLKQGKVSYTVDITSDDPELAMTVMMMVGSKMDMYFDGARSRSEVVMGTLMSITTVVDSKEDASLMLTDIMGQKNAIKGTLTEMTSKNPLPNYTVTLVEETKQVLGYSCKKALLVDGEGNEMVVWYTNEIVASTKGQLYFSDKMPGFPLEYTMKFQGMNMKMTAIGIEKKLGKDVFDLTVPEGYVVEENESLKK